MTLPKHPSFIVIGAPKAGTTSLFHYLQHHPAIYLPKQKELHFFSYKWLEKNVTGPGDKHALAYACQTINDYTSHFKGASTHQHVGEISPSYLYFSETAEAIQQTLGAIKIVVILRNPISKAHSQYMHLVRDNREQLEFYDALMTEASRRAAGWSDFWRYAGSSLYSSKLEHFLNVFGQENVKTIFFEELIKQPTRVLHALCDFLEISSEPFAQLSSNQAFNPSGKPKSRRLASLLARPSFAKTIVKTALPGTVLAKIRAMNTGAKGEVDEHSRTYLEQYFAEDLKRLEDILERPLPWDERGATVRLADS